MTKTVYTNGSSAGASVGNQWQQAADAVISRTQHAPGFGLYFPEAEGAVGNGSTNDSAAVLDAINAAAANDGQVAADGIYGIGTAITIASPVQIIGRGTFKAVASITRMFLVNAANCVFDGVTLDGQTFTTGSIARVVGARTKFQHCKILATGSTSASLIGLDIVASSTVVDDNDFSSLGTAVKVSGSTSNVTIDGNRITNWINRGIYCLGADGAVSSKLTITNNWVSNLAAGGSVRYPIRIEHSNNASTDFHTDVTVSGNHVQGNGHSNTNPTTPGTADQISLNMVHGFTVANNISLDGGDGGICIAQQCADGTVTGNVAKRADSTGLYLGSNGSTYTRNITVTGNTFLDNGINEQGNITRPSGMNLWAAQACTIGNNILGNSDTTAQQYGAYITSSSNISLGVNTNAGLGTELYHLDTRTPANTGITQASTTTLAA